MNNPSAKINCVVFDIGNVAAYSDDQKRQTIAQARWGATFSAHDFKRMMRPDVGDGLDYWRAFQNGQIGATIYLSAAVRAIGLPDTLAERDHFGRCLKAMFGQAYQPTLHLARHLRQAYQLTIGVLTNNNEIMCETAAYQLATYADVALSSHKIYVSKPQPEAYHLLLSELKRVRGRELQASSTLFIDDKAENVKAAQRLGMQGFIFPSREKSMDDAFQDLLAFLALCGFEG